MLGLLGGACPRRCPPFSSETGPQALALRARLAAASRLAVAEARVVVAEADVLAGVDAAPRALACAPYSCRCGEVRPPRNVCETRGEA